MIKTVEIEYVGIEDLQDIMDDMYALQQLGHFADLEMRNLCSETRIEVNIMLNGWDRDKEYDYHFIFFMNDDENEVNCMNMCKSTLKNLLAQED